MREPPMPFISSTLVLYFIMSLGIFYMDFMLIRGWRYKHTIILILLRPLTLFIFYLFNPIPDVKIENLQVMIALAPFILIFAIGIGSWGFLNLLELLRQYYRSKLIVLILISIPVNLLFIQSMLRLF